MNEDQLQSSEQAEIRTILRVGGGAIFALGAVFTAIGLISFFSAFASAGSPGGEFGPPRYFWCAFIGLPMLAAGTFMLKLGFLGAFVRYIAGESAPVTKAVVNYMGENTEPGIKAVAKSITEGVREAQREHESPRA
jgi:hypothetical protein